jgi:hypothetical protein
MFPEEEDMMTDPEKNTVPQLSGEDRLHKRSQRIRSIWIATMGLAFMCGLGFGVIGWSTSIGMSSLFFWGAMALFAAGMLATNVWFMRRVDEVEVQDNLWAAFAGFNVHALIAVGWAGAAARGLAPAPDVIGVFMGTLAVTLIAYLGLKLRRRLG